VNADASSNFGMTFFAIEMEISIDLNGIVPGQKSMIDAPLGWESSTVIASSFSFVLFILQRLASSLVLLFILLRGYVVSASLCFLLGNV
jgi:hypothetical protein